MVDSTAVRQARTSVGTLNLRGGWLCLDFANTVDPRAGDENRDYVASYDDLVAWSRDAGALTAEEARRLETEGARHPAQAAATLRRAVELREAIYRIFSATSRGDAPAGPDLELLNRELARAMSRARIAPAGQAPGWRWEWSGSETELDLPLFRVARSAAELLTSDVLGRARECSSTDCGWLFLDASKNRSRRWCTMEACGNRAKARRLYQRRRSLRKNSSHTARGPRVRS